MHTYHSIISILVFLYWKKNVLFFIKLSNTCKKHSNDKSLDIITQWQYIFKRMTTPSFTNIIPHTMPTMYITRYTSIIF